MKYKEYKVIEQYFKLGDLIEQSEKKIEAVNRVKNGLISLHDIVLLQEELTSFGLTHLDTLDLEELHQALTDEITEIKAARKDLRELSKTINLNIDKLLFEKECYEIELENTV